MENGAANCVVKIQRGNKIFRNMLKHTQKAYLTLAISVETYTGKFLLLSNFELFLKENFSGLVIYLQIIDIMLINRCHLYCDILGPELHYIATRLKITPEHNQLCIFVGQEMLFNNTDIMNTKLNDLAVISSIIIMNNIIDIEQ